MRPQKYSSASIFLCLTIFCVSCAAPAPTSERATEVVTETKVEKVSPPPHLLKRTPEPVFEGQTCADVIEAIRDWRTSLGRCNADKQAVIDWLGPPPES